MRDLVSHPPQVVVVGKSAEWDGARERKVARAAHVSGSAVDVRMHRCRCEPVRKFVCIRVSSQWRVRGLNQNKVAPTSVDALANKTSTITHRISASSRDMSHTPTADATQAQSFKEG